MEVKDLNKATFTQDLCMALNQIKGMDVITIARIPRLQKKEGFLLKKRFLRNWIKLGLNVWCEVSFRECNLPYVWSNGRLARLQKHY